MDHDYIREHSLIERYHQGRLPPEEEARFEAHFVGCRQCTEELELARGFRIGIRAVAAEVAVRLRGLAQAGILARLALALRGPAFRRRPVALAAAAALTAVVATSAWFNTAGRGPGGADLAPLADTPVFILSTLRSDQQPVVTVDLATAGDWLALAVDVDDDPRFDGYRLTVFDAGGGELWRRDGLLPNALETLMVTFPATFFAPGDYRLTVEGVLPGGEAVAVDGYPFRVAGGR